MSQNRPHTPVKFLVLSGGLGGSPYVKTQLEAKYSPTTRISIIRSQEPRLSVVKGLVMDRRQRLTSGTAALRTRMCVFLSLSTPHIPQIPSYQITNPFVTRKTNPYPHLVHAHHTASSAGKYITLPSTLVQT